MYECHGKCNNYFQLFHCDLGGVQAIIQNLLESLQDHTKSIKRCKANLLSMIIFFLVTLKFLFPPKVGCRNNFPRYIFKVH